MNAKYMNVPTQTYTRRTQSKNMSMTDVDLTCGGLAATGRGGR